MENEKDITKEEFKETAGMQFARAVKPTGCILLLLILLGVLYLCFTSGTDPIPGYEALREQSITVIAWTSSRPNFRNMFFRSWTATRKAGWRTENLQLFWKTIPLQCPAPQSSDTMMKNSLIFREQANKKWNNPQTDNRRFIR